MQSVTLHRGIAVPAAEADRVVERIRAFGIEGTEGTTWKFHIPDPDEVRRRLDALYAKPDLTREDILGDAPSVGICACGTASGAAYYACKHNFSLDKNDHPIALEFRVPVDGVYVDSRDFLCAAFQLWDRNTTARAQVQESILSALFGPQIIRYFSAARESSEQTYRIAMCNLAAFDPAVLEGHLANRKSIAGRYGTRFSSAFFFKAPVTPEQIVRVYVPQYDLGEPADVTLEEFLNDSDG